MTQRDKILKLFEGGRWVKVQEMNSIAYRYGAILFNLRKEGYIFQKRKQHNSTLEEWKLVSKFGGYQANQIQKSYAFLDECSPITPEQTEAIRKRLSDIKEHHERNNC